MNAGAAGPDADGWPDDSALLTDVVRAVLARSTAGEWTVGGDGFWCRVTPPRHDRRAQGWKLHVSATQLSAPVVLSRAAEVLVRAGCAFKFARGLNELGELLSASVHRGSGGKFLTAYPRDDAQLRRLAVDLDRVTDGLPGPEVLSDRAVRPGSLVHYRFGVFGAEPVLDNDGSLQSVLTAPDGRREKDLRQAWFSPPAWAEPPFAAPGPAPAPEQAPSAVLLGGRFAVRGAVRHSYRGGVFRALDHETGAEVVVKQARPHVMGWLSGKDARDTLRHEAAVLDLLGTTGLAPRKVALLTQQENVFLAEELVPGVTLRAWAAERAVGAWRGAGVPWAEGVRTVRQLVDVVAAVHGHGLVLRDLTPDNLMVTPEGRLRLVGLEHAVAEGSRVHRVSTLSYASPEQTSAPIFAVAPARTSDLYGLGAVIFFLVTGVDPLLPLDEPALRPGHGRLAALVGAAGTHMETLRRLSPLVLGLTRDEPGRRWSLARAREFLAAPPPDTPALPAGRTSAGPGRPAADTLPDAVVEQLVEDGLGYLVATMTPQGERLWKPDVEGATKDACSVQHGAAGVLGVLTRAARLRGGAPLRAAVAATAGWVGERLTAASPLLPGLYSGRSGTAWALHDAAGLLDDAPLSRAAADLALRVPVLWPSPGVCHGAAGAGTAQLHFWQATGDERFLHRAAEAADGVLRAAREREGRHVWPVPETFDSALAGSVHYGFAHGVAGVGAFLLCAGTATGRAEYLDGALRAGRTLDEVADREGGLAWWPPGEGADRGVAGQLHRCSGSSGVGTFLVRLWAVTGQARFRELAQAGAAAVHRDRWHASTAACHGLAGDGDFLLDLADLTGDGRYREWAGHLAAVMYARHAVHDGRTVLPDESGAAVTAGHGTGLAGALGFLLRLRHGGPRLWMTDELLTAEGR
ncbi:class IV lanthionine synthetase LanL [Actinacidiphila bryophytorum]|uniref:Serine/threonine protein kinase n=1 Tax=Actinacidiphila bryophytorum TaxID=1436133 RepID=A0A9W4E3W4_9ACTN|nr:class IV lanthionine synthetase LanL [Actinacidiphila bryophytorum]MBM9438454.1 class IV lanthionine synthetase LanL [Actinacidiphila bryophytorum]MBN6542553.1 class IV lanthionine synthetase LanL [Actinacidiphila bryophytorum]CAG7613424.1 Serine/threonine protein kinase [Actinacidiphila bryophytorum]